MQRLFNLLPPRMPIAQKLELAGNIWAHYGPRSSHYFVVGPLADVGAVTTTIQEKLETSITSYAIPVEVRNRFEWLSTGDIDAKEQLLNHFRELDRNLAIGSLQEQLPVLQQQMRDCTRQTIGVQTRITVQRHTIDIWIDERLGDKFCEGTTSGTSIDSSSSRWIWWILFIVVVIVSLLIPFTHQ